MTLADQATNSLQTENAIRTIQGNVTMQVRKVLKVVRKVVWEVDRKVVRKVVWRIVRKIVRKVGKDKKSWPNKLCLLKVVGKKLKNIPLPRDLS